jgi:polysaccharide biosynthesis/export protein VpsN
MRSSIWVVLAVLVACSGAPPAHYPTLTPIQEVESPLGAGDVLDVVIYYGSKENKATYRLTPTGKIAIQYIGDVVAAGKTVGALQDEIKKRLADGYLVDPIVSVSLTEANSTKVSVFGQVQKAGTIRFQGGMTIVDAIAQSGGFTAMAKKNGVQVTRVVSGKKVTYTVPVQAVGQGDRPNFPIHAGDLIFVPERWY